MGIKQMNDFMTFKLMKIANQRIFSNKKYDMNPFKRSLGAN